MSSLLESQDHELAAILEERVTNQPNTLRFFWKGTLSAVGGARHIMALQSRTAEEVDITGVTASQKLLKIFEEKVINHHALINRL
jgi:hypothetical protein